MAPDGSGERILTSGGYAEGPSWAPNGRAVMFTRGASQGQLWYVDVASGRDPAGADPARRLGPGLVAAARLTNFLNNRKRCDGGVMKNRMIEPGGRSPPRCR